MQAVGNFCWDKFYCCANAQAIRHDSIAGVRGTAGVMTKHNFAITAKAGAAAHKKFKILITIF